MTPDQPQGNILQKLIFYSRKRKFSVCPTRYFIPNILQKNYVFIRRHKIKDFLFSYHDYKINYNIHKIQYQIIPNYYDHISHVVIENWLNTGNEIMTYDLLSDSISKITNKKAEKKSKDQISFFWVLLFDRTIFSFSSFPGTLAVMERKVEILRTSMWVTAISIVTIKNWPANVRGNLL